MRKYATEFVGTFFLVFTICTTVLTKAALAPLAIGLVLAALVFAGGHVSGAHYNPAVTLAVFLRGRMSARDIAPYMVAQVLGAVGGAELTRWMVGPSPVTAAAATGKVAAVAFVAELVMTFVLVYVVLNVATSKGHPDNSFYGLAIGFTVTAGAIAVGGLSGAVFNPAVAVGVAAVGLVSWSSLWLYFGASLVGGVLAAGAFRLLNPADHEKPSRHAALEQIKQLEELGQLDPIGGANPDLVDAATPQPATTTVGKRRARSDA
jgi:aquaporin Z